MTKPKFFIIIIAVILISLAVLLCAVPRTTKIDQTMDAVKLDADGNVLGTVSLHIQASADDYLFRDSIFSFKVSDFDSYIGLESTWNRMDYTKLYYGSAVTQKTGEDGPFDIFNVYSSPSLDRWLLWNQSDNVYYVISTDSGESVSELMRYFSETAKELGITDPMRFMTESS